MELRIKDIFCTPDNQPYVTVNRGERDESYLIGSSGLREYIECLVFEGVSALVADQDIDEAERWLRIKAISSKNVKDVHIRTARTNEGIEIDLNNEKGECVLVRPGSWEIAQPKSCFIRPRAMASIPYPAKGGGMGTFAKYFNVQGHNDLMLLVGFSLFSLWPKGPYPILNIKGPKGSGKSTAMECLKTLTDPVSTGARRMQIETIEQLFIAAKQNKILPVDNVSSMSGKMSDAYCCLATGGAFGKRAHYTNDDEHLIDLCRPVIMNGITDLATRTDLISRLLSIEFACLPRMRDEEEFWASFEQDRPYMLGYLLDGLACALKSLPKTKITSAVRLVDFLKVVTAAEEGLEWKSLDFQKTLEVNQHNATTDAVTLHPLVKAITSFMSGQDLEWPGTMQELYDVLSAQIGNDRFNQGWPKAAHLLSREMDRLSPDFPKVGIEFTRLERKAGERPIKLRKLSNFAKEEKGELESYLTKFDEE